MSFFKKELTKKQKYLVKCEQKIKDLSEDLESIEDEITRNQNLKIAYQSRMQHGVERAQAGIQSKMFVYVSHNPEIKSKKRKNRYYHDVDSGKSTQYGHVHHKTINKKNKRQLNVSDKKCIQDCNNIHDRLIAQKCNANNSLNYWKREKESTLKDIKEIKSNLFHLKKLNDSSSESDSSDSESESDSDEDMPSPPKR